MDRMDLMDGMETKGGGRVDMVPELFTEETCAGHREECLRGRTESQRIRDQSANEVSTWRRLFVQILSGTATLVAAGAIGFAFAAERTATATQGEQKALTERVQKTEAAIAAIQEELRGSMADLRNGIRADLKEALREERGK